MDKNYTIRQMLPSDAEGNVEAINTLMQQIALPSDTPKTPVLDNLLRTLSSEDVFVAGAFFGEELVGMAALGTILFFHGSVGLVEDVVVNKDHRGHGLGKALMGKIIEYAKERKIDYLQLTSKPERVVARNMYKELGFEEIPTGFFELEVDR